MSPASAPDSSMAAMLRRCLLQGMELGCRENDDCFPTILGYPNRLDDCLIVIKAENLLDGGSCC
jgi:hypothetical protein